MADGQQAMTAVAQARLSLMRTLQPDHVEAPAPPVCMGHGSQAPMEG